MDISIISHHLKTLTKRAMFDTWVSTNLIALTNYFYSLSQQELLEMEFDQFYFGVFTPSPVFREYETLKISSDPFVSFMYLLAATGERLAQRGSTSTIDHIESYLQPSSLKFRLQCVSKLENIDDAKSDYIRLFPEILELLAQAENFEEENYTQRIVDLLIFYYKTAEKSLTERHYSRELMQVKTLFSDRANIGKYRFLGHAAIQEVVDGSYPEQLEIEKLPRTVLYPTREIAQLFTYGINAVVLNHPDSIGTETLLGYHKTIIRNQMLDHGKTDFTKPFKNLQPDDKVLLYCYFYMKKHFFTSKAVFEKAWPKMRKMLSNTSHPAVFIDIGCGPLTSGLALADLYQTKESVPLRIHYIGVDIAPAMLAKAEEFSVLDLFDEESTFDFKTSWNELSMVQLKAVAGENSHIFVNTSYLFASSSLNVENLAKFVSNLAAHFKYVHFIFQNPDRVDRNVKWEAFKKQIAYKEIIKDVEKIIYKTNPSSSNEPGSEDVRFEILEIKQKS